MPPCSSDESKRVAFTLMDSALKEFAHNTKLPIELYDVEVYNGKSLLTVITVSTDTYENASKEAIKGFHVKIKRAHK